MNIWRYRLVFKRDELAKNMTHLEQIKLFRTFLNTNIDCMVSNKKISFGPAISVGYESLSEFIDIYLNERKDFEYFKGIFIEIREKGFELLRAESIPLFFPSIESSVEISEYEILLERFEKKLFINASLNEKKKEIIYEKGKKNGGVRKVNIKEFIYNYNLNESEKKINIYIRHLAGKTVKPEIVLNMFFGYEGSIRKIIRKAFYWIDSKKQLNKL